MIPRAGDFGLTVITGPLGLGIRLGQWMTGDGSPYQHAFVVTTDEGQTVEAMPGGARHNRITGYDPKRTVYVRVHMAEPTRWAVAGAAEAMMGPPPVKYSFLQYPSLALLAVGLKPKALRRFIKDRGHVICSQLIDLAFQRAGVELFDDGRDPGDVTPGDLWRHLTAPHDEPFSPFAGWSQ